MPSVIATSSLASNSSSSLQLANPESTVVSIANYQMPMNVESSEIERPLEIAEDVKFAQQRHRVKSALESAKFKHDLEAVLGSKTEEAVRICGPTNQTIPLTDICSYGRIIANQIPINDIRSQDGFTQIERDVRCRLVSLCRLIALHGWSSGIYNHVSARIDPKLEHFLVNPFGILYYELTASSLIKVDNQGHSVVQSNFCGFSHNQAIFILHSAIHRVRPDVKCIVHLHSKPACTVSSIKDGLLPLSHEALLVGGISYHEYKGICGEELSRQLLCEDLGPFNKILILRNHGVVVCAESIEEAWFLVLNVMKACEIQCESMSAVGGQITSLIMPNIDIQKQMIEQCRLSSIITHSDMQWKKEELEFEAYMRILDNAGMRTGYRYKFPYELKTHTHNDHYDCTIPAIQSSLMFSDNKRPCRSYTERTSFNQKAGWMVSPNSYIKQHSAGDIPLSSGIKWSTSKSFSSSTPVRVPQHSFAPLGTDIIEFKQKQEQMKENRVVGRKSAGPITEICRNIDQYDTILPSTVTAGGGCERKVVVGAVSRAIVKKDYQDKPDVYKSTYSSNPFTVYELQDAISSISEGDHQIYSSVNSDREDKTKHKTHQHRESIKPDIPHEGTVSDSSSIRASSPEHKNAERKKSSFRTPSFLKRTKKRSQSHVEKHMA